jgi:hypothetical protein
MLKLRIKKNNNPDKQTEEQNQNSTQSSAQASVNPKALHESQINSKMIAQSPEKQTQSLISLRAYRLNSELNNKKQIPAISDENKNS